MCKVCFDRGCGEESCASLYAGSRVFGSLGCLHGLEQRLTECGLSMTKTHKNIHTITTISFSICGDSYFDSVMYQKEREEPSAEVKDRMEHGTVNEINTVSIIVVKVLPMFYLGHHFVEEGCYEINENGC